MKLKVDMIEFLGKTLIARKSEIAASKKTNIQFDKGLEK